MSCQYSTFVEYGIFVMILFISAHKLYSIGHNVILESPVRGDQPGLKLWYVVLINPIRFRH